MNRLISRSLLVCLALAVGMPMARAADSAGDRADVRVRNHGVPGANSRDALAGLPKILKGRPEHKDCLNLCVANSGKRNGNHPTARGYRFLADEVAKALRGRVKAGETVACVGDSLTYGSHMAGEGTATGTTYPAFLAGMLRLTPTTGN